jgi:CBS domain-containing protein
MSAPVITVDEETSLAEIARLLTTHCIKRVPVVRGCRTVGIVSRADLVRALVARPDISVVEEPKAGFGLQGGNRWS